MKTRKLNKKTSIESLVMIAGLTAGFMVSGAIDATVPVDKRMIARVGTAGAGAAGAALLPSTDNTSSFVKMVSAGAATRATVMLVQDQVKPMITMKAAPSTVDKALYGAVGLACACDGSTDYALRAPLDYPEINVQTLDTTWDEANSNYQVNTSDFAV